VKNFIYALHPGISMEGVKHKIKQKVHRARLKIYTSKKLQTALYILALLILVVIVTLLVTTTINQQKAFVKYHIKSCYDKGTEMDNSSREVIYATKGKNIVVASYTFAQKCFDDIDVDHTTEENNVSIHVSTRGLKDDCICESNIQAEIGPLVEKWYTVNIFKKADNTEYLVDIQNITLK